MNILITGGCGFVGSNIALYLKKKNPKYRLFLVDNFSRKGSKFNFLKLKKSSIKNYKINITNFKKLNQLPSFNLVIDCCAEPSVEKSKFDMDKTFYTNLVGTYNICKLVIKNSANIIFLSSSRVYSIAQLNKLISKKISKNNLLKIDENFSTEQPVSLYGYTKISSEQLIKEMSFLKKFKFIINRCGVIAGPGQFGKVDQGFLSFFIWNVINDIKIKFIGYGGSGDQIRDVLHIDDLCHLIDLQIKKLHKINNKIFNVGGGRNSLISLKLLLKKITTLANKRPEIEKKPKTSFYDIPYYVTNNFKVNKFYNWQPKKDINNIIKDVYDWQINNLNKIKKYFL
jgi:CDP-paratose 2-epimerase